MLRLAEQRPPQGPPADCYPCQILLKGRSRASRLSWWGASRREGFR